MAGPASLLGLCKISGEEVAQRNGFFPTGCPQIPPVVLLCDASGHCVPVYVPLALKPPWPQIPHLAATFGARVDHTCTQPGQGGMMGLLLHNLAVS